MIIRRKKIKKGIKERMREKESAGIEAHMSMALKAEKIEGVCVCMCEREKK